MILRSGKVIPLMEFDSLLSANTSSNSTNNPVMIAGPMRGYWPARSKSNGETVEQYLKYFKCIIDMNQWTDTQAATGFRAMLQPNTSIWSSVEAMSEADQQSFNKIAEKLKVSKEPMRDSRVRKFFNLSRSSVQSLDELAIKIHKLVEELYSDASVAKIKEKLARDRFYTALGPDLIAAIVNPTIFKTLDEMKIQAISTEDAWLERSAKRVPTKSPKVDKSKPYCNNCAKKGHDTENCWSKSKKSGGAQKPQKQSSSGTSSSSSSSGNKSSQTTPKVTAALTKVSSQIVPRQFLRAIVNNKPAACLIDNGSKISIFPSTWPVQRVEESVARAANGSIIAVKGESIVNIDINGCVIEHTVFIGDVEVPLLGRDFIRMVCGDIMHDDIMYFTWKNRRQKVNLVCEDDLLNSSVNTLSDAEIASLRIEQLTVDDDENDNLLNCAKYQSNDVVVDQLIEEYSGIFTGIGRTNLVEHKIELKQDKVVNIKPYPIPYAYRDEVRAMLSEMQDEGIIEQSYSEWCSPLLVLKKKDGSLRLAIDYRKLNSLSKFDAHPTPKVGEILCGLDRAKIFSKLDFKSGYYQVPLRSSDQEKTAFKFENRLYHFKVMPFGLSTAAQTFARLGNLLFQLPFVKIYIDDVIVFSNNLVEHRDHLRQVFEILKSANLTLNRKKCDFAKSRIEYLGFVISNGTIRPSQEKTDCVDRYPVPKNRKDLRSFLGLVNSYRNLIEKFAEKSYDLYELLKCTNRFVWKSNHQEAFENLKKLMMAEPVVRIADLSKQFIVRTDASDKAMAGVLQQIGDDGNRYVVEYFSKKYTDCQSRYSTIEKEATALKTAIDKWSTYLKGKPFKLETDHRPLVWLQTMANRNNKLSRMAIDLAEYQFEVQHVRGVENCDADALSRIEIAAIQFDELWTEQEQDQKLQQMRKKMPKSFVKHNNLWYFLNDNLSRLCIPQCRVKDILRLCHDKINHVGQL